MELGPERFELLVEEALDGIPPELGRLMENVALFVNHDSPPGNLYGLYEGVPLTDRAGYGTGMTMPDRITIYRQTISAHCSSEEELMERVRVTVVHEVAHHFGISDERLLELRLGMTATHFAVSAVGSDRPGIVAAVTGVLLDQGCNLEDTEMAVLRGHFAMMLVVTGPEGLSAERLESGLTQAMSGSDLVVAVRAIDGAVPPSPQGEPWSVSVYGADRPGLVHRVASLLAEAGANIVDLETRVIGEHERPVYAMLMDVTLPPGVDAIALAGRLEIEGRDVGVECSMRAVDVDVL